MTRFMAYLAIILLSLLNILGNMWFTYGLWPQNWWAFFGFGVIATVVLKSALDAVRAEE
jgi:hypothetical protein